MSEASQRQLERDLPRVDMYSPAFRRRVIETRKREAAAAAALARQEEIAARGARREQVRREEIERAFALKAANEEQAKLARQITAKRKQEAQLAAEGILPDEPHIPAINIIKDTATKYGLTVAHIRGPSRLNSIVAVRHEAMAAVALARPDLSLPALGRIFNRDHTSILFALRKMGARK